MPTILIILNRSTSTPSRRAKCAGPSGARVSGAPKRSSGRVSASGDWLESGRRR
jgi:hypothetical protein